VGLPKAFPHHLIERLAHMGSRTVGRESEKRYFRLVEKMEFTKLGGHWRLGKKRSGQATPTWRHP
jgi:hypothetical protein